MFHIPHFPVYNKNVHISVLDRTLWDVEQAHLRICEIALFSEGMTMSES